MSSIHLLYSSMYGPHINHFNTTKTTAGEGTVHRGYPSAGDHAEGNLPQNVPEWSGQNTL